MPHNTTPHAIQSGQRRTQTRATTPDGGDIGDRGPHLDVPITGARSPRHASVSLRDRTDTTQRFCAVCESVIAIVSDERVLFCGDECWAFWTGRRPKLDKSKPYGSKRGTCAACGDDMWRGSSSKPQGEAVCRECLRAARGLSDEAEARRVAARRKAYVVRESRVSTAPGLTRWEQRELLARWKRQGRRCYYCPAPPATVDHVLPLSLGGTNYEGNLVPACASCNCRKSSLLLIVFRIRQEVRL